MADCYCLFIREDIMQRCACIMPAAKHALADAFLQPLPGKTNQKFHCWLLQTVHNGTIQPVHLLHLEAALGIPVRREMFLIINRVQSPV